MLHRSIDFAIKSAIKSESIRQPSAAKSRRASKHRSSKKHPTKKPLVGVGSNMLPSELREIKQKNPFCADCARPNPEWGCINLGILVCIDCSGAHRKLGSHISKA